MTNTATLDELLTQAVGHHQARRYAEAQALYAAVLDRFPEHPDALHLMGVADWRLGNPLPAIDRIARALAFHPDLPNGTQHLIDFLQEAFGLAESRRHAGETGQYLLFFLHLLEARAQAANSYLMRQYFPLTATASLQEALNCAAAVSRNVRSSWPFESDFLLALIAFEQGRICEGADGLLALARAADTAEDAGLLRRLGNLLLHYRCSGEAEALFRRALALAPAEAEAMHGLGRALFRLDRYGAAARTLRRSVALIPRHYAAFIDLGTVHHALRQPQEALAAFQAALAVYSGLAWALVGIGAVLVGQGRRNEGLAAFQNALALNPDLIEARIGVGSLLIDQDTEAALGHFIAAINAKRGLQLSPIPDAPGMYESMRGYSDALYRLLGRQARDWPAELPLHVETRDGEEFGETAVAVGRLRPLAAIPDDGAFHLRDPAGRIAARRIGPAETLRLSVPDNHRPGIDDRRYYGNTIFHWLARAYERFAWSGEGSLPDQIGNDGTFLTRIEGCRIVHGYVLSPAGDFYDESLTFDELVLFGQGPGRSGFKKVEDRHVLRFPVPAFRIHRPCNLLTGYHAFHYGAWLLNMVPKLIAFESAEETRGLPYLLSRTLYDNRRFVRETLEALGIGKERLLLYGSGSHELDCAYAVTIGTHILSPGGALAARRRLLEACGVAEPVGKGSRLFYISRRDAAVRRVLNEDQLIALLERYGVTVIANAELDMQAIVTLFADARCVIGVNGAGMTNLLFCPQGVSVIELCPDIMIEPLYWMLGNLLGHRYSALVEHSLNRNGDFVVSLDRLAELLDQIL